MQTTTVKKWDVFNTKAIINNLKQVFETKDIERLNGPTYKFLMNLGGFIAHYDINGFKQAYRNLRHLIERLEDSDDLQKPNRYIDDPFFQKDLESKDYYTSKTITLRAIWPLITQYKEETEQHFVRKEKEQDLKQIKFLMAKHGLKTMEEVKQ